MPKIPYFSIGKHSFEKNSGYKSTVHAIAELIDNSVEADATEVTVVLMVDRKNNHLKKIAVGDNGSGMKSDILQRAICEKSGTHLDRQTGSTTAGRRKFGKYGVGLPKASISQCNRFIVWSWTKGGPEMAYRNGVDIDDDKWTSTGANVEDSVKEPAPEKWVRAANLVKSKAGTLVLWEDLDGLTWAKARWGHNSGLIPNLEFTVGRTYRHLLKGPKPELAIHVAVIYDNFKLAEPALHVGPNDPLYCTPGCKVPKATLKDKSSWPPHDPLFDDITGDDNYLDVSIPSPTGEDKKVRVTWRRSAARKDTFSRVDGHDAGDLPHGKHAARNVGLSLLREQREVDMSQALCNPSEPRERWIGVEFNFPIELDEILGMTNNKQSYTRLDQILKHGFSDFQEENESVSKCIDRIRKDDPPLAVCLEIAWKMRDVWNDTRRTHLNMRTDVVNKGGPGSGRPAPQTPEEKAEAVASTADKKNDSDEKPTTPEERAKEIAKFYKELVTKGNVPEAQAKEVAERMVNRGLTYAIITRSGLGSPFFNIGALVDAKLIELNEEHAIYPYILSTLGDASLEGEEKLRERLAKARLGIFLMLEAWAKIEAETRGKNSTEYRKLVSLREDWGRSLSHFVELMNEESDKAGR